MQQIETTKLIRKQAAAEMLGVSLKTLERMVHDGRLPQPTRLSLRLVGWPAEVLNDVIRNGAEKRAQ